MKQLWRVWKYSLGSFHDTKTKRYDNIVAIVRTLILFTYLVTNSVIVAGVVRHWNDL
mgnify:CR=1 FL=1